MKKRIVILVIAAMLCACAIPAALVAAEGDAGIIDNSSDDYSEIILVLKEKYDGNGDFQKLIDELSAGYSNNTMAIALLNNVSKAYESGVDILSYLDLLNKTAVGFNGTGVYNGSNSNNLTVPSFNGTKVLNITDDITNSELVNKTFGMRVGRTPASAQKKNTITKVTKKKTLYRKNFKKKKTQSFQIKATVKGGAKKSFKLVSVTKKAKKFIKVSKTGKVTVKKGIKVGTIKIRVKITALATKKYKARAVNKVITLIIK